MRTRLLCTGDSHIGRGIPLYETRLSEQEELWRDTLTLARDLGVDAVLHAGDMFDARRPGPDVMLAAERPLVEHRRAGGPPVFAVVGNHDVPSLDGPCGLDVLAEAGLLMLARKPRVFDVGGISICCLPWAPPSLVLSQHAAEAREDLLVQIGELAAMSAAEMFASVTGPAVLMTHWSITGSALPNGLDVGSLGGVVLPLDMLSRIGYGAIVAGHIHRPQMIDLNTFYVGSPMPLDHGEAACDHGVWMLEEQNGMFTSTFHELDSRSFSTVSIDFLEDGCVEMEGYRDGDIVRAIAKVSEENAGRINPVEIREMLIDGGAHVVTGVHVDIQRADRDARPVVAEDITPQQAMAAYLKHRNINGTVGTAALARAAAYLEGARA